jgi:hypothetical protein
MEALALSHSFVAYESPESELQVKSLDELGLKIPNSAWIGVAGIAVALSVLGPPVKRRPVATDNAAVIAAITATPKLQLTAAD